MHNSIDNTQLTREEIILFLEDVQARTAELITRISTIQDPLKGAVLEDANTLYELCKNLELKLKNNAPLTAEEASKLDDILQTQDISRAEKCVKSN